MLAKYHQSDFGATLVLTAEELAWLRKLVLEYPTNGLSDTEIIKHNAFYSAVSVEASYPTHKEIKS